MFNRLSSLLGFTPEAKLPVIADDWHADTHLLQLCKTRIAAEQKRLAGKKTLHPALPNRRPAKHQGSYEFALDLQKILEDEAKTPSRSLTKEIRIQKVMQHLDNFLKDNPHATAELTGFLQPFISNFPHYLNMLPQALQQQKEFSQTSKLSEPFYDTSFFFAQIECLWTGDVTYSALKMLSDYPFMRLTPLQLQNCFESFCQQAYKLNSFGHPEWTDWRRNHQSELVAAILAILNVDVPWSQPQLLASILLQLRMPDFEYTPTTQYIQLLPRLNSKDKCALFMVAIYNTKQTETLNIAACFTEDDKKYLHEKYYTQIGRLDSYHLDFYLTYARAAFTDEILDILVTRFVNEFKKEITNRQRIHTRMSIYFKNPPKLSTAILKRCQQEQKQLASSDQLVDCVQTAMLGVVMNTPLPEEYRCRTLENFLNQGIPPEKIKEFIALLIYLWNKPLTNNALQDRLVKWVAEIITPPRPANVYIDLHYFAPGLRPADRVFLFNSLMFAVEAIADDYEKNKNNDIANSNLFQLLEMPIKITNPIHHIRTIVNILKAHVIHNCPENLLLLLIKHYKAMPHKPEDAQRRHSDLLEVVFPLLETRQKDQFIRLVGDLVLQSSPIMKERMTAIVLLQLKQVRRDEIYTLRVALLKFLCQVLPFVAITPEICDAIRKEMLFKIHFTEKFLTYDIPDSCYKILVRYLDAPSKELCLAAAVTQVQENITANEHSCAALGMITATLAADAQKINPLKLLLNTLTSKSEDDVKEAALEAIIDIVNSSKDQDFQLQALRLVSNCLHPAAKLNPKFHLTVQRCGLLLSEIYFSPLQIRNAVTAHTPLPDVLAKEVAEYVGHRPR